MPWWTWTIIGVVVYLVLVVAILALCKAASDEDERRGYK